MLKTADFSAEPGGNLSGAGEDCQRRGFWANDCGDSPALCAWLWVDSAAGHAAGSSGRLAVEAAALFSPFITLIKAIPTMAIILLAIIWLKSNAAPVLVVFLISFPVLYWSWKTGMEETDRKFLEMAAVFRVSFSRRLWEIYLPTTRPYVWAGVSSALGLGFKVCIGAEVLCQPRYGIGSAFQIEKANLNTAGVFAWAIICVALVGILDLAVKKLIAPRAKKSEKM